MEIEDGRRKARGRRDSGANVSVASASQRSAGSVTPPSFTHLEFRLLTPGHHQVPQISDANRT
jgi:hypothetical protein